MPSRRSGHVELADGVRHRGGLSVETRVLAPHLSLQLRELADHLRDEVALRKQACTLRVRRLLAGPAHRARHPAGQSRHPARLGAKRAELALEDDAPELFQARLEATPSVGVEEVRGVLSRGRMTRSLPARTVSVLRLSMLLTATKCGISAPLPSATGK